MGRVLVDHGDLEAQLWGSIPQRSIVPRFVGVSTS